MASPQPTPQPSIPLSIFLMGAVWAIGFAMAAPATLVFGDLIRWRPIDWGAAEELAVVNCLLGIASYWRKYAALLKLPPGFQEAKELAEGSRIVTTTVTATVKDTQVIPAGPKP